MTDRTPCHGHEHEAAYITAIGELADAMHAWIQRNPGVVLSWREVLSRRPVGLEEPGAVEALAASPDAARMLRDVDAATAGHATLRMARIALGIVGQLRRLDVGGN